MRTSSFFKIVILLAMTVASQAPSTLRAAPRVQDSGQQSLITQAMSQLNTYAALQTSTNVQNTDLAIAMRKALLAAELLIGSNGALNLSMCAPVKAAFIPPNPREWEVNMGKVIDQLDATWQPFFSGVRLPAKLHSTGALALRALFSMDTQMKLTDRHAKIAVLAAMLAPYNQGPVGDCFAVNDVIRDHQEFFHHAAEDYRSIIMNGYLNRTVDGKLDYFFFLPILADEDLNQPFTLKLTGAIARTTHMLFDAPGFAAARTLMGGNANTTLMQDVLKELSQGIKGSEIQVTPTQVIAAMAQVLARVNPSLPVDGLISLGEYAFSSLTNQPVLRGVESAFAAMAEDRSNDSVRSDINSCVAYALEPVWKSVQNLPQAAACKSAFSQAFNGSFRLFYQLNIPLPQISADGSSSSGGFQLYQKIAQAPDQLGIRIATPQDFKNLVLNAISSVENQMAQLPNVETITGALTHYVNTDDFLIQAFWAYDPQNQKEPNPIQNYLALSSTPMQTCSGDDPFELDNVESGPGNDNPIETYTPNNAKDLITWCLNLAKIVPMELISMASPQHAFNFTPTNPDIAVFLKKGMPAAQWLQNILIVPGMQVARKWISSSTEKAIALDLSQMLSHVFPDMNGFQKLINKLNQSKLTVKDYASQLVTGLNRLLNSDQQQAAQVGLMIDGLLIQHLPSNDRAVLEQSAIRFAFTNWNQGTENIYFCAYFNPRTEQVGFGSIYEDKTNLQPMDEEAWVNHQQWEVDLVPNRAAM
ncbi:MAG: hypothetical protein K2P51_01600 [Rhabdochlamydiaceae bacterium]|nr:hypothetical protein [Rhabdochlamydiaceae bacterium]